MGHGVRGVRVCAVCVIGFAGWAGAVSAAGAGEAPASSRANHFVRMSPEALADALAKGVRQTSTIDYGTYVWTEFTPQEFARLDGAAVRFEERRDAFTLRLGELSFDPRMNAPNLPSGWDQVQADTADLHLVQFVGPARAEWLADLEAQGLTVVQYIHPFTYIVWGEPAARDNVAEMAPVRWTGGFAPAYRVLPRWRQLKGEAQQIDILLYRGADTDAAVAALKELGGVIQGRAVMDSVLEIVTLSLPGTAFQAAAHIPGVYTIQPEPTDGGLRGEMSDQVSVNNVDGTNRAFPGYLTWLSGVGITGAGVIIANVDGGADQNHTDLVNRFIPCSGITCGGAASSSHGTHTSGIMAADGSSGALDGFGFLRGLGQAPGANLVEQVFSPFFTQSGGMLLLMTDSYNNGASLSGNSWGPAGTPRGYDGDTRQVDVGVRDADPNTPGNQPLSFVLSIMNGNGGTSTQGTPDEAKNLFAIGSTKMQTSSGAQILQIDDVSANSAHGPALDGRKLPHMVAPGCSVDSTVPGGHGVSGWCGTSMASPHVSGAVALFIEYYRGLPDFTVDPSPAMVKAAFTAVARDLAGHLDADGGTLGHPFDNKQGWGRMDVEAVIDPSVAVLYFDNPAIFDNTGEEWIQSATPLDPALPMRLMLVWTDAPGVATGGSTPAWSNDLDLVIEADAGTYLGNNFGASGWSIRGGSADFMNNTEGIFLGPTPPASITIRVVAANISSDGIPNEGDGTDQDFALVCYNCTLEPVFNDCNNNGVDDLDDLSSGTSADCNENQTPDECELADGSSEDCNGNLALDECDISSGTSPDGNGNGVPDECEMEPPIVAAQGARYLAVTPQGGLSQEPVALLVTGDPLDPTVSCVSLYVQVGVDAGLLGATPVFQTPAEWGTVHVYGEPVIPDTLYSVQAELATGSLSSGSSATTWLWGDVHNDGDTGFLDILEMVRGFKEDFSGATLEAMDQDPCIPDGDVDFLDMLDGVNAFKDRLYSFKECPAVCP